jgi:hypothetical protein
MAIFALRELAPDRIEAAQALADATRDTDLQLRRAAFTAMAALTALPPGLEKRLLEAIREDGDAASRRLAALALGEIGGRNPGAISEEAIRQLRDAEPLCPDPDLRRAPARSPDWPRRRMARMPPPRAPRSGRVHRDPLTPPPRRSRISDRTTRLRSAPPRRTFRSS